MNEQNIELHIEELVLHGFSHGDSNRIAGAVERELARLIKEKGLPEDVANGEIAKVDGGSFQMARGSKPETTGALIAKAVYGGMKR